MQSEKKYSRVKRVLWLLGILFFIIQGEILAQSFEAFSNAEEVLEGHDFQVTFKLNGAKGAGFRPPSFENFSVVGGPNSSTSMTIINGRTSQSMSYTYALMPKSTGSLKIGKASIKVGGATLTTDPLTVNVLKASDQKTTGGNGEDVFLELELSDSMAYVGQQIILKYVIYTAIDIRSYNFINEGEYNGFYVEELPNYREKSKTVVRNGKQYLRQPLKAVALFPQQTGKAEIGSALVNLGIAVKSERPSFFFSTSMKSKRITTPATEVRVLSTPPGAPMSFSGAIGSFKMTSSIDRNAVTQDGAVTLKMNIEGDGDARFISPPKQSFDGFEIYDPNLLNESSGRSGGKIKSIKSYEYLLVPEQSGLKTIRPEFTFFNVDSSKYITLYGSPSKVRVTPGKGSKKISTEDVNAKMAPIATVAQLYKPTNPIFSWVHLGLLSTLFLGFMAVAGVKWNNDRIAGIDPKLLKSKKAQRVAIAKLSSAKSHLDKGEIKPFYIALSEGLFSYVADKQDLSANNISKDDLSSLFKGSNISDEIVNTLSAMIKRSEMAVYAGFSPDEASGDYNRSIDIIMEIEKSGFGA